MKAFLEQFSGLIGATIAAACCLGLLIAGAAVAFYGMCEYLQQPSGTRQHA